MSEPVKAIEAFRMIEIFHVKDQAKGKLEIGK